MSKKNKKPVSQQVMPSKIQENQNTVQKDSNPITASLPIGDFFSKYAFPLTILLISAMAFWVYKDYILNKKVFLFKDIGSDTLNFYYPYGYLQAEYFHQYKNLSWSFQYGMGQSVILFCIMDFFNILFYIFDTKDYAYLIIIREMLKLVLTGVVFFQFLRVLNISKVVATYGSIILCFSGYMVLGGSWYIFSYDVFCVAFMLWALELAFSKNNYLLVPFGVFFIAISQPFNLYIFGLFFLCYLIIRIFTDENRENNFKTNGILFGKLILFGIIGMLISMPFFLENFFQMLESPRGSGEASYVSELRTKPVLGIVSGIELGTSIFRFLSSDSLGTGNAFKGYNNYLEAPIFYIGIATLILVPQIFSFINRKARIAIGIILGFWLLPLLFPYFRYAIWGFVGDYYRGYSFVIAMIFAILAILAFDNILKQKRINLIALGLTLAGLLLLTSLSYFPDDSGINKSLLLAIRFLVVVYSVLLFFISRIKNHTLIGLIFLLLVAGEAVFMSSITVNKRDAISSRELKEKVGYNDYSKEAINYIKSKEKSTFYRIDKTYGSSPAIHSSLNDAMLMNHYSSTVYSSFNQKYYINFLQKVNAIDSKTESSTRWSIGLTNRSILQSLNSVKYILAKTFKNPQWKYTHDSLATFGDVSVFRHKYILPMGYAYSNYMPKSEFEKMSVDQKDYFLLKSFFIDDTDLNLVSSLNKISSKDSINLSLFSFDVYRDNINLLKKDTLNITSFKETEFKGKINSSANQLLYLSMPYDKGWHLKVDGKEQNIVKVNAGMTGFLLNKGEHQIEMNYELPYFGKGLILALIGLALFGISFFLHRRFSTKNTISTVNS